MSETPSSGSADDGGGDWSDDLRTGNVHYIQGLAMSVPQSGLGIASLVVGVVAGVVIAASMIAGAMIVVENPNVAEDDPHVIGVGCGVLLGMGLSVPAGILGIVGLFPPDRAKTCAILGVVLAGLEFFGVAGLLLLGLMFG